MTSICTPVAEPAAVTSLVTASAVSMVFHRHVLAFDVASFLQTLTERRHVVRRAIGRPAVNEPDHRQCLLLRPHRARPTGHRAAEGSNKFPPSDAARHRTLKWGSRALNETIARRNTRVSLGRHVFAVPPPRFPLASSRYGSSDIN